MRTKIVVIIIVILISLQAVLADTTFTDQGNDFIISEYSNSTVTTPTTNSTIQQSGNGLLVVQDNQLSWKSIFLYGGIILMLLLVIAILIIYISTFQGSSHRAS